MAMARAAVVAVGGQLALSASAASSSSAARKCAVSLPPVRPTRPHLRSHAFFAVSRRQFTGVSKATEAQVTEIDVTEAEAEVKEATSDLVKNVKEAWAKVDDKVGVGSLGVAALVLLWGSTGLIAAIDKLPFIPGFFEFVGLFYTGWFIYRNLLFKPDREEFLKSVDETKGKITGQ